MIELEDCEVGTRVEFRWALGDEDTGTIVEKNGSVFYASPYDNNDVVGCWVQWDSNGRIEWAYFNALFLEEPSVSFADVSSTNELQARIKKQIALLEAEQCRAKMFLNENGFDCTTASFVIVKQYRDALKKHIEVLRCNLDS